jgi:FemAB family protein
METIPIFFKNIISQSTLDVVFRNENRELWQQVLDDSSYVPVEYMQEVLDFQLAYESGLGTDVSDISIIIKHDKKSCVVWPLFFKMIDGIPHYNTTSKYVLSPLFTASTPRKVRKLISKDCISILEKICKATGIGSITTEEVFNNRNEISEWHYEMVRAGAVSTVKYELIVDLSLDIEEIKSRFRKSYKSLINSGLRLWQVEILNHADRNIWNQFKELHFRVAGRLTRSEETWEMHLKCMDIGKAFLVCLRDKMGSLVGAGFFLLSKTEGYYGVAVYDRLLFSEPLGHVVQYVAIAEMKRLNIPWYKIGVREFKSNMPEPTQKELSIAEFKEGFASQVAPRFILTYNIDKF